ncbi:MAG: HEPN domain-containing protein [Chloroflexi bacterium]|nr:HEPN domain-containing protein [Chloroflexota bacterium]
MNGGIVSEWVEKAEGDFNIATREMRVRKAPNYDALCFHAQQCVEKYLKAVLVDQNISFKPIHDLEVLLNLITPTQPEFEFMRDRLLLLNDYAVDYRYPGVSAARDDARAAVKAMRTVRAFVRQQLGLVG